MVLRFVVSLVTVLAIAGYAVGQEDDYLDRLYKSNPNELYVDFDISSGCMVQEKEFQEMIDGILTRSRIKRLTLDEWREAVGFERLYLDVYVNCDDVIFSNMVRFADMVQRGRLSYERIMHHTRPYGSYGVHTGGAEKYLKDHLKTSVERALTDYLKANFDL